MAIEVRIPELGESVTEGVIVRWLKQDGELVQADESVLELETDKATLEIPATASGRLEIVERKGATVRVGTVVARIAEGADRPTASAKPKAAPAARGKPSAPRPQSPPDSGTAASGPSSPTRTTLSPSATTTRPDARAGATGRRGAGASRCGQSQGRRGASGRRNGRPSGWNRRQRNRRPPPRKSSPLPPRGGRARCRPRLPRRPMRSSGSR